jgi:hypothetical protein
MDGILIFEIGLGLSAFGFYAMWKYDPKRWLADHATVVESYALWESGVLFTPYVRYRYEIDGITYHGDHYAFSGAEDLGSKDEVDDLLRFYAVGALIPIWYQTGKLSSSCIKLNAKKSRSQIYALIAAGGLIMGLGVLIYRLS